MADTGLFFLACFLAGVERASACTRTRLDVPPHQPTNFNLRTSFDVLVRTMSSVGSLWSPRKLRAASSLLCRASPTRPSAPCPRRPLH